MFTDLGDMVSDVFGIKADTKKSQIGDYFNKIADTMGSVKQKLQDELSKNGNYERVKKVVDKFIKETLDKIAEVAKEVASGAEGTQLLGNMPDSNGGGAIGEVDKLIKGIKIIVEAVELKEGNPEAGTDKRGADDGNTQRTSAASGAGGELFATGKTVDGGLKEINEALASVNQGDMSVSETNESGAAKK
ncbi:hypothetical protein BKFM_00009 [Borrelia sp. HM]|nr:hypothetical protein BKFM_00009 [Borrelia sp. HM]